MDLKTNRRFLPLLPFCLALLPVLASADSQRLASAHIAGFGYQATFQELAFSWPAVAGADHYRLAINANGQGAFSIVPGAEKLRDPRFTMPMRLWGIKAPGAQFRLEACGEAGECATSTIAIAESDLAELGQFHQSLGLLPGSGFGSAIAISADGSTLAVAAPDARAGRGGVQVFSWLDGRWRSQAWLPSLDDDPGNHFGTALAISGDGSTLAIGAPGDDAGFAARTSMWRSLIGGDAIDPTTLVGRDNSIEDSGAVFVFRRRQGNWSLHSWLKATNADVGDAFGHSLSISDSGDLLAVGAPGEDGAARSRHTFWKSALRFLSGTSERAAGRLEVDDDLPRGNDAPDSGAVYLYSLAGDSWQEQLYIKASNTDAGDGFGACAQLSGDGQTLFVGAPFEDSDAEDGRSFLGRALIALAGDPDPGATQTTAEDEVQNNNDAAESGAVYVYILEERVWLQQAWLKAANTGAGDRFGCALAASQDGDILIVGAPYEDSADHIGSGFWPKRRRAGDQGDPAEMAIDGLDPDNNDSNDAGAAYIFERSHGLWSGASYIKPSDTSPGDNFGHSLALSVDGGFLAIGSPRANIPPPQEPRLWRQLAGRIKDARIAESTMLGGVNSAWRRWRRLLRQLSTDIKRARHQDGEGGHPPDLADGGAVYIFKSLGESVIQRARFDSGLPLARLRFGHSLALDNRETRLVIGAPGQPIFDKDPRTGQVGQRIGVGAFYTY